MNENSIFKNSETLVLINTREIPAFGGISLALRGSRTPPLGAFGGGKREKEKNKLGQKIKINWGAFGAS